MRSRSRRNEPTPTPCHRTHCKEQSDDRRRAYPIVAAGNGYDHERPLDYVRADRGANVLVQIDKGLGRQLVAVLWLSAMISGVAIVGLIATCFFIYKNIGYTAVLEYDLMDLRSKMGQAHENTPQPENDN